MSTSNSLSVSTDEEVRAIALRGVCAALPRLDRYLDGHATRAQPAPLPRFDDDVLRQGDLASLGIGPEPVAARLGLADLAVTQALCRRVWAERGGDEPWLERWLLHLVGFTREQSSVPFWIDALGVARVPDAFLAERRTYALAALASLASSREGAGAQEALLSATRHRAPAVRGAALAYLVRTCALAGRSVPAAMLDLIARVGREDLALEPRLFARQVLETEKLPMPPEAPAGAYTFAVTPADAGTPVGTIEIRTVQTLAHLHVAIQSLRTVPDASGAYAYFLAGEFRGGAHEVSASERSPRPPGETTLGALGLLPGHTLHYRCEAPGEPAPSCVVALELAGARDAVGPSERFPRITASSGRASPHAGSEVFLLRTHVNGTKHYDAIRARPTLAPGNTLILRREPSNPFDDRAVEVVTEAGEKLGYVPRARNRALADLMDAGERLFARLEVVDGQKDWPYVVVAVYGR